MNPLFFFSSDYKRIYTTLLKAFPFLAILTFQSLPAWSQTEAINSLETVNTFYGRWACTDGEYIYGVDLAHPSIILRKTDHGQSWETRGNVNTLDVSFKVEDKIFGTTTPGLIFFPVSKNSVFYLVKSSDGGQTFKRVFTFGEGNGTDGTNTTNVRLLRGLLELTRDVPGGGGKGTLFIGEYNVSHSRVTGGANDRVRIMKSTDDGETWTKVVEWNTNGSNQVGHIHAMKQDPYTGEIYICIGDDNSKSGIIKWDGSSEWSDNKRMSEIGSMSGFRVFTGKQRYRTVEVLFDENYFYTFADTQKPNNPGGTESGIWRGEKDFSAFERMDNQIYDYDPMHIGWFGGKIGDTFIFTTSREYLGTSNAWSQMNTQVYISNDGIHWHATGVLDWRDVGDPTQTRYITNVFTFNDKFYVDCTGGAGHYSTIQCDLSRKWKKSEDPVILHPVFFVGNWNSEGNDANRGWSADAPKATLNNALTSSRISAGARVRVAEGSFHEPGIYPSWSSPVLQGKGSVVIEGQGMNETHIIRSSGGESSFGIRLERARTLTNSTTPLILKNLEIYLTADEGNDNSNFVLYNIDSYFKTINCKIGNESNDDAPLVKLLTEGSKYTSENSFHIANANPGADKQIVSSGSGNTSCDLKNCIIMNAHDAFDNDYSGAHFSLKNCDFYAIEHAGVIFHTDWSTTPVIKNCIFSCGESSIINMAGSFDTDIDYNWYNKEPVNIAAGDHSLYGSDPMYADAQDFNFNLLAGSPCKSTGTNLSDILFDFSGAERNDPPCIGAYESNLVFTPLLLVSPAEITIDSAAGHTGEFTVISNTGWTVSDTSDWLNLSVSRGTANSTVSFTADSANLSINDRTALITFSFGAAPVVVKVIQTGSKPFLLVSPSSLNIDSIRGATGELTINSNTSWSVSDNAEWLSLSSSSGSGKGKVTISGEANKSILSRTATLTFTADGVSPVTIDVVQQGQAPFLSVTPASVTVNADSGSTAEFTVSSNIAWNVQENTAWLSLSSSSGTGNGTIVVKTISTNLSAAPRNAIIKFSADNVSTVDVGVVQQGKPAFLTVTPSSVTINSQTGSSGEFNISSNTVWNVSDNAEWLSLSSSSGSGNGNLIVRATGPNPSVASRTANIIFSSDNISPVTVTVTQEGQPPFITITPSTVTLGSQSGSTGEFIVSSNISWTVSDSADWLSMSASSGSGNGKITISGEVNSSTRSRTATLTFSADGVNPVTVEVIQQGHTPFLSVTPSSLTMSSDSDVTSEFTISSNITWNVVDDAEWLSLSASSGSGDGTLVVKTGSINISAAPRSATIKFFADNVSTVNVVVTQQGKPPFLTVTPASINITSESDATGIFNVASNTGWTVSDNADWLSLSSSYGSGNGTLVVKALSVNSSAISRSANLIFSADNISPVTVVVTQPGQAPFLTVTPSSITLSPESGSTGDFTISSNISWNVSSNAEWLSLSSSSGSNNGTITVKASSANRSKNPRNANITFFSNGIKTVTVKVFQSGIRVPRNEITGVNIYPNPVSDILSLEYEKDTYKSVSIFNSGGELVKKETIRGPVQQIDFSRYRHGLYILEFEGDSGKCERMKVVSY